MAGTDPHYLHKQKGIRAVLQPPIEGARALTWLGQREVLLVATAAGQLVEVDPVYGTRNLSSKVQDPAALSSSPDGKLVLAVERGLGLAMFETRKGERLAELALPLLSEIQIAWIPRPDGSLAVVVLGQTLKGRMALIADSELRHRRRVALPAQTVVGVSRAGKTISCRVLAEGLEVLDFGRPIPAAKSSAHRLRFCGQGLLLGLAEGGLTVWQGTESRTVMCYGVTAADVHHAGQVVALGTRSGNVAFASLAKANLQRARPGRVSGHREAVRQIAFSKRGPWLASSAKGVRLWRWGE